MELRIYWEILCRRRWLFALILSGSVISTLILCFFVTPVYKATTKVLVKGEDVNTILATTVSSSLGKLESSLSADTLAGSIKAMLENKEIAIRLIDDLQLQKQKGIPFLATEILDSGLISLLMNKTAIRVKRLEESDIFELSGFSSDPALAVQISEKLTLYSLKLRENLTREATGKVVRLLTKETIRLKRIIEDSEEIIKNYKVHNMAINLDEKATSYTSQLSESELSIAKLAAEKRENHPDIRVLLEQITFIKRELQDITSKQNKLLKLERMNTALTQVYSSLLSDLEKAKILKAMSITNFMVIEKAQIPDTSKKYYKYFPKKKKMLALALIIGSFLGVITVYFTEYIDDTIKSPRELKAWTGQKILATIPMLKDTKMFPPTEVLPILEALSDLWLSIKIAATTQENRKYPHILTVTSYGEKEGKSLVSANLGLLLSKNGHKTLIVDFNLRVPFLSKLYAPDEKGLTDFIAAVAENKKVDLQLFTLLSNNLYFLPTGSISRADMVKIANSPQLPAFIENAKNEFDVVIIDTASLNKSREPFFMAKESDATIVVVEAGRYQIENIRWAIDELKENNAIIAGIVLNKLVGKSNAGIAQ